MIVRETIEIDGKKFIKNYSDKNVYISRYGETYSEAIDPIQFKDEGCIRKQKKQSSLRKKNRKTKMK